MAYILIGSNGGIMCKVLAVTDDSAIIHSVAMGAKSKYDVVRSFKTTGDAYIPTVGSEFDRPLSAPLVRDLNQPWYGEESAAQFRSYLEKSRS